MRISDFNNYPNFFFLNNNKYLLKITKEKMKYIIISKKNGIRKL